MTIDREPEGEALAPGTQRVAASMPGQDFHALFEAYHLTHGYFREGDFERAKDMPDVYVDETVHVPFLYFKAGLLAQQVPEGFKLVPVKPTPEMVEAGKREDWVGHDESRDGRSILPDDEIAQFLCHEREYAVPDDEPNSRFPENFTNVGIWAAMLDAAPTGFSK